MCRCVGPRGAIDLRRELEFVNDAETSVLLDMLICIYIYFHLYCVLC